MTRQYTVANEAVLYILFQRTEYLQLTYSVLFRAFGKIAPEFTYNRRVALESKLRTNAVKRLYLAGMEKEYLSIKDCLPDTCSSILDIGCGIAGIDLFLQEHYNGSTIDFFLLDKSEVNKDVYYMYEQKGSFYNSLELANSMLVQNGINGDHVHILEATMDNRIKIDQGLDLVISLISWGFHYPVDTYLDKVHGLLNPGGVLILDVRKGTPGLNMVNQKFGGYTIIYETDNSQRICTAKPDGTGKLT